MFVCVMFMWDTCLCFHWCFKGFSFRLKHTRPNWGPTSALLCSRRDSEGRCCRPVDIQHFLFYCFVPYAALFICLPPYVHWQYLTNQTIVKSKQFKQWYLLFSVQKVVMIMDESCMYVLLQFKNHVAKWAFSCIKWLNKNRVAKVGIKIYEYTA